jgi:2-oxoglutarate ferredoxin oxidoreductase subunit delta
MARKGKVLINRELCKGCFLCIRACQANVLEEDTQPNQSGTYPCKVARVEKCGACGNCWEVCPDLCIEVYQLEGAEA